MIHNFLRRENQIFELLREFKNRGFDYVLVGGYAVSAFQHRFSVDADVVIRNGDLGAIVEFLRGRNFEKTEGKELTHGQFLSFEKSKVLPVTVDLLVDGLQSRQTGASWSYNYFKAHAIRATIEGLEEFVEVLIPEKELLIAIKLHSGRLTDVRDVVAVASNIKLDKVVAHALRGNNERLREVLHRVSAIIERNNFEDAFKGVFSEKTVPKNNIRRVKKCLETLLNGSGEDFNEE